MSRTKQHSEGKLVLSWETKPDLEKENSPFLLMAFEVVSSSLVNESAKKDWVKRIIVPFQWQGPYSFSSEHSKTDRVICGMNLRDTKMCHSGQNDF